MKKNLHCNGKLRIPKHTIPNEMIISDALVISYILHTNAA